MGAVGVIGGEAECLYFVMDAGCFGEVESDGAGEPGDVGSCGGSEVDGAEDPCYDAIDGWESSNLRVVEDAFDPGDDVKLKVMACIVTEEGAECYDTAYDTVL